MVWERLFLAPLGVLLNLGKDHETSRSTALIYRGPDRSYCSQIILIITVWLIQLAEINQAELFSMSQQGNDWWSATQSKDKEVTTPKTKGYATDQRTCPPPPQKSQQPPQRYDFTSVRSNLSQTFEEQYVTDQFGRLQIVWKPVWIVLVIFIFILC